MEGFIQKIWLLPILFFLFLMIVVLAKHFSEHFERVKLVKMELDRADDEKEYAYWERELSTLRWCIIPGVRPEMVEKVRRFLHRKK